MLHNTSLQITPTVTKVVDTENWITSILYHGSMYLVAVIVTCDWQLIIVTVIFNVIVIFTIIIETCPIFFYCWQPVQLETFLLIYYYFIISYPQMLTHKTIHKHADALKFFHYFLILFKHYYCLNISIEYIKQVFSRADPMLESET